MDEHMTIALVEQWPQMLPGCYEALDEALRRRDAGRAGAGEKMPGGCLLPVRAAYDHLYSVCRSPQQAGMLAAELTACWMWQKTGRTVRVFSPEETAALADKARWRTEWQQQPAQCLLRLPQPILYCRAAGLVSAMDGFFCWVNDNADRGGPELRIQWLSHDQKHSAAQALLLLPGASIHDCMKAAFPEPAADPARAGQQQKMAGMLWKALPFVLELAKEAGPGPEAAKDSGVPAAKRRFPFWPKPKKSKGQ